MRKKKPYTLLPELTAIVKDLLDNDPCEMINYTLLSQSRLLDRLTKALGLRLMHPSFTLATTLKELGFVRLGVVKLTLGAGRGPTLWSKEHERFCLHGWPELTNKEAIKDYLSRP